jgi:hypothetical protein
MGNSYQPEFDRQSLDALRSDLAKILELRSELVLRNGELYV